mmetsp:Transcript_5857/g.12904  ORF Transcript_5857/g.12904 Transcript_5857/m.12904 type:complete len:202 (+) Transcript_5857:188-793(+)
MRNLMYCWHVSWHLSYSSTMNLRCLASVCTMMICRCCAISSSRGSARCWLGCPFCRASSRRLAPRDHALLLLSLSSMRARFWSMGPPAIPSSCLSLTSVYMLMPVSCPTSSFMTSRSNESPARRALARNWQMALISISGCLRHAMPVKVARDCSQSLMLMPSILTLSRSRARRVRMVKVSTSKVRGVMYLKHSTIGSTWFW